MTHQKTYKNISLRNHFIKVYNYLDFAKKVKGNAYSELQKFTCTKAPSLEKFIREEVCSSTSIYIVYDTNAKIIIGYYTLMPACMLRELDNQGAPHITGREIRVQKNIPCLEIEKFAINEKYLDWLANNNYNNKKIGYYVFWKYISKTILLLSEYINFSFVILHAIRNQKVQTAYKDMSFETFEDDELNIVSLLDGVTSIKDDYVKDCKFMYLPLDMIITETLKGGM